MRADELVEGSSASFFLGRVVLHFWGHVALGSVAEGALEMLDFWYVSERVCKTKVGQFDRWIQCVFLWIWGCQEKVPLLDVCVEDRVPSRQGCWPIRSSTAVT